MKAIYNVDWLEFYCQFDRWRDREWIFEHLDWYEMEAEKMPYTTRVYGEVWKISSKGEEVGTLCCVPLSSKEGGGILPSWACQFKFANWVCYNLHLRIIVENTFKALSISAALGPRRSLVSAVMMVPSASSIAEDGLPLFS